MPIRYKMSESIIDSEELKNVPKRKMFLTEELKSVLKQINSDIATTLLEGEIDERILSKPEKNLNYIDLSHTTKGHLSYLTKEKIEKIEAEDNNYWEPKRRYHARPGSVIKKLLKINDWELENFTTQFLSIVDPPVFRMEVVKGEDIAKYYDYHNYFEQRGSLGGSCMKTAPAEFFQLYVDNPNQIGMLVMLDQHDKVMGRAILWFGEDFKVLDRIYVCNDLYINYFYNWANENNCYHKEFNNFNTPKNLVYKGEKMFKEFEITLDKADFQRYPYHDSFKWLDIETRKIYNHIPKDVRVRLITVSDHQGNYFQWDYFGFCQMTNSLYMKCDLIYLDYLNMEVYSGNVSHSYTLDRDIWSDHAVVNEEIRDRIFGPPYEHLNDKDKIEAKKKRIRREDKARKRAEIWSKIKFWQR